MLSSLFSYERHVTCREGYIDFQKHRNFIPTYEQIMRYFPWCLSLLSLVGCRPIYLYRHQGDGPTIFSNGAIGFSYNAWKCTVKIWTTFLHVWPALSAGLDALHRIRIWENVDLTRAAEKQDNLARSASRKKFCDCR